MKYYFISYAYRKYGSSELQLCNDVCEGSPYAWFKRIKDEFKDGDYTMISFNEMTKEEFDEYGGWFG